MRYLCSEITPSYMFDRALNTYLLFSRNANGVNVIPLNEFFPKTNESKIFCKILLDKYIESKNCCSLADH